jgi:hypothetical protein
MDNTFSFGSVYFSRSFVAYRENSFVQTYARWVSSLAKGRDTGAWIKSGHTRYTRRCSLHLPPISSKLIPVFSFNY